MKRTMKRVNKLIGNIEPIGDTTIDYEYPQGII